MLLFCTKFGVKAHIRNATARQHIKSIFQEQRLADNDMTTTRIDTCPICKDNHLIHRLSYTDSVSGHTFEILQCTECGLHITQQAPSIGEMNHYYPDEESKGYKPAATTADKWIEHLYDSWRKEQVKIVKRESRRESGVLLEMGSKQGYFARTIRNTGWIAHGVEYDTTAREYANKRFQLQIEDGRRLFDIHPRSYNVVVAWDSVGEATDLHRTIEKLSQLIVSDGTLIIAFHDASSDDARQYGNHWSAWDAPRKRWHLTPGSFEKLIEQHNLQIINQSHSARRSFITHIKSEWSRQGKQNIWSAMFYALKSIMGSSKNDTYYIYTLKHKP